MSAAPLQRFAIIVPIVEGAEAAVEELLDAGPPFDPAAAGLDRHEVFLTGDEVIFVFESRDGTEAVEAMLAEPSMAPATEAWELHMAGPPRLARLAYVWSRPEAAADQALLPPGLREG
jgi:hypothetical protein